MTLEETLQKIHPLDEKAMEISRKRWDSIAKPLHSLGKMEDLVIQIAGIQGTPDISVKKRALVSMCADNGVVEEGVTQTGQEVTKTVTENMTKHNATICIMSSMSGADVYPVDIGIATDCDNPGVLPRKIKYGTDNMAKGPAMSREEAIKAIEVGIDTVAELKEKGYDLVKIESDLKYDSEEITINKITLKIKKLSESKNIAVNKIDLKNNEKISAQEIDELVKEISTYYGIEENKISITESEIRK